MQETYITLEEAARFEGIKYNTLIQRMKRNPARYKTRTEAREGGGKELVLLSTASLSQKGRRAYRAQIRAMAEPEEAGEAAPWYVEADLGSFIEQHKRAYYEAVELARRVHVSSRTIISLEKGPYNPSLLLAYRMALELHTTMEELYCLPENKEEEDRAYEMEDL